MVLSGMGFVMLGSAGAWRCNVLQGRAEAMQGTVRQSWGNARQGKAL